MKEIRITAVPENLHDEVKSLAKNHGVSISSFLKPKIREIVNSYPKERREYKD